MPELRLGGARLVFLLLLSALAFLPGLGSSGRLTYHEAFVAQGAREILHSNHWAYPTIGDLPWLEKPPLPWWLVAALGFCTGRVDETVARLPSAAAATLLVVGVAILAARHYGRRIGLLAGAVQATTAWTVVRGRLAEADILLACLITWAIVAFDRILVNATIPSVDSLSDSVGHWRLWRWAFLILLGLTALVKGIGFGAVVILLIVAGVLTWQRDSVSLRRLQIPAGWILAITIALWWPVFMVARHGYGALSLWTMHISDRLIRQNGPGSFASEPWWEYIAGVLAQALPWTPLALVGAWPSLVRAVMRNDSPQRATNAHIPAMVIAGDRLLWVWAVVPLSLLALASVKNAHYAISTQIPWSIWAALALAKLGDRLRFYRFKHSNITRAGRAGFAALALTYAVGLWFISPWFDRRGMEWAFYEMARRQVPAGVPLTLLYDDWDRKPYESPFGPIPHDLAVRLFYLGRVTCWHMEADSLLAHNHSSVGGATISSRLVTHESADVSHDSSIAVIGRDRDLPALRKLGQVEVIARGPSLRRDRTYALFRITPDAVRVRSAGHQQARGIY